MSHRMTISVVDRVNDAEVLRNICGISKVDLANEIGISRWTYYTWIRGDNTPNGKYEPDIVRAILWMQGLVEARERKEKRDARKSGSGDNV